MNYKSLVIGIGQIGSAIAEVLECDGIDTHIEPQGDYDVIHVCFPYSDKFIEYVKNYQKMYQPIITVIHSTVPIGTSAKLGAVYSPVRGKHPDLAESVRTFEKFIGYDNQSHGHDILLMFREKNIPVGITGSTRDVEAMKLWDTTQYGWSIILQKEIKKYCDENNLNFGVVYTHANRTYNSGYEKMGMPQFKKYILTPTDGKIGGHCVIQNCDLLDSWITNTLAEYNENIIICKECNDTGVIEILGDGDNFEADVIDTRSCICKEYDKS